MCKVLLDVPLREGGEKKKKTGSDNRKLTGRKLRGEWLTWFYKDLKVLKGQAPMSHAYNPIYKEG
jgi:hypothetical protein